MKKFWIGSCLALLGSACDPPGGAPLATDAGTPCAQDLDLDLDTLAGSTECEVGLDPLSPDTDRDGVSDGVELHYPHACVAPDPSRQRRPAPRCLTDAQCRPREACRGLDPLSVDTDGDTVIDSQEDSNADGTISLGETDPRLLDTDGDDTPDGAEGLAVCRTDGLTMPALYVLASGRAQIALGGEWGAPRPIASGLVFDDVAAEVAGLAIERPASFEVGAEAMAVESALSRALAPSLTPVLVGRRSTTDGGAPAITSFFRLAAPTTAAQARDDIAIAVSNQRPAASRDRWRIASELYVEVTTVLDTTTRSAAVLIAIAPADAFDDPQRQTAIRMRDLTNATGLARSARTIEAGCEPWSSEIRPRADFLWLVDTSPSMNDDQARLASVARRFVTTLSHAGVDFRIGVLEAAQSDVDLDSAQGPGWANGFGFIESADPLGARELEWRVTRGPFSTGDGYVPFDLGTQGEEPVAAGVRVVEELERFAESGSTDPNRTLRSDSQVVVFFVTDEPGTNDDTRFFANEPGRWGRSPEERIRTATEFYASRGILTFGLVDDFGHDCPAAEDFAKCTILGGGGALIPIRTATDDEVRIAMDRVVEAVAGAASRFVFERTPISSSLRVWIDGAEIPRSRANGFDYDGASRSIVVRGRSFQPSVGSEILVSYRSWGAPID